MSPNHTGRPIAAAILIALVSLLVACDLPTEGPSFSTEAEVNAPILARGTYTFLGGPGDAPVLIDTTTTTFSNLFVVDPADGTVTLEIEAGTFDVGRFQEDVFEVGIRQLGTALVGPGGSGSAGLEAQAEATVDFRDDRILTPAGLELSGADRVSVNTMQLTDDQMRDGEPVNGLELILENQSATDLTDGEGGPPRIRLIRGDGSEVGSVTFDAPIPPGESATGILDLTGQEITADMVYELAVSGEAEFIRQTLPLLYASAILDIFAPESFAFSVTGDVDADGRLDLTDDARSRRLALGSPFIDGLDLEGSELILTTNSSVQADAELVGAFLGSRRDGQRAFLGGREAFGVAADDPLVDVFQKDGAPVAADDLLRLGIGDAPREEPVTDERILDNDNSTVEAFINNLPNEVRFSGKTRVQVDGSFARLRQPVTLDAALRLRLPLSFRSGFTLRDTLDLNLTGLRDLTDPDQIAQMTGAELIIAYENALPMGADVALTFQDAANEPTVTVAESLDLQPAPKATDTGLSDGTQTGALSVPLGADDLRALRESRFVELAFDFETGDGAVPSRLRAADTLLLSMRGHFNLLIDTD